MHVLITCKYKRTRTKTTEKRWRHGFPHYKSMGAFCCHGNQSFHPICPNILCSLSPTPVMLQIKIWSSLTNWFQRYSGLNVWMTDDDDMTTTTDWQRTIGILEAHLVSHRLKWAKNLRKLRKWMPNLLQQSKHSLLHHNMHKWRLEVTNQIEYTFNLRWVRLRC